MKKFISQYVPNWNIYFNNKDFRPGNYNSHLEFWRKLINNYRFVPFSQLSLINTFAGEHKNTDPLGIKYIREL